MGKSPGLSDWSCRTEFEPYIEDLNGLRTEGCSDEHGFQNDCSGVLRMCHGSWINVTLQAKVMIHKTTFHKK